MRFTCQRQPLNEALTSACRVVSPRAAQEHLKGILLECLEDSLVITGSDTDISLTTRIEAHVSKEGSCVIEARIFSDIVRRLSDENVEFAVNDQYHVSISNGLSVFEIAALPADRYNTVPEIAALQTLRMTQSKLKRLLGLTSYAVSQNEARGVHTGVLFDLEPHVLTLVALDGHRMALAREYAPWSETCRFVVHAGPLAEIERLLSEDEEKEVVIRIGTRHAVFDLQHTTVVARLLEGEFLNYRNSIPKEGTFKSRLNVKNLYQAVERVSLLINDKIKHPIRFTFEDESLKISCSTGLGKASDTIAADPVGQLEIGFNNRYILDALRHSPEEEMIIECSGPLTPFVFMPPEGDEFLFFVLPVRLSTE